MLITSNNYITTVFEGAPKKTQYYKRNVSNLMDKNKEDGSQIQYRNIDVRIEMDDEESQANWT